MSQALPQFTYFSIELDGAVAPDAAEAVAAFRERRTASFDD